MQNEIKKYVDALFKDAPDTPEARALKEEILSNLNDKYNDLKASGVSDSDALNAVKAQVGDIGTLIAALPNLEENKTDNARREETVKKRALLSAIGVTLIIISPVFVLLCHLLNAPDEVGPILLISCVSVGLGLFVYRSTAYKMRGSSKGSSRAGAGEIQKQREDNSKSAQYIRLNWLITVCVYFIFSFATHSWNISWIIFLIGAATAQLIKINVKEG